jgi:hypothetical protein
MSFHFAFKNCPQMPVANRIVTSLAHLKQARLAWNLPYTKGCKKREKYRVKEKNRGRESGRSLIYGIVTSSHR